MKISILNKTNSNELETLINEVEENLKDKRFWLPIGDSSRNHFFDSSWTIFFGAFEDDRLIGAIGLFLNENEYGESQKTISMQDKKIAEVGRIMCHPEYRHKGVASCLMEELLRYSGGLDLDYLLATVHPHNEPSQRLLKKYGFIKEGYIIKSENYERDILIRRVE